MKNLFAVNFAENTIIASKTTLKKASIPNSPEYKALMKLMKQNPTFTVAEKDIKEAIGKKTYKGLDKAFVEKYISDLSYHFTQIFSCFFHVIYTVLVDYDYDYDGYYHYYHVPFG